MDASHQLDPVERAIRKAQEEGAFDDLPGVGQPIPGLDRPYDPAWWARNWVERDRSATKANELAARVRREVPRALGMPDHAEARAGLESLNTEITACNAADAGGTQLPLIDIDAVLDRPTT